LSCRGEPGLVFRWFFQAEGGIRDRNVTGVQTCALPISAALGPAVELQPRSGGRDRDRLCPARCADLPAGGAADRRPALTRDVLEIGRASCRERGACADGTGTGQRAKGE